MVNLNTNIKLEIMKYLKEGCLLSNIAKRLNKSKTAISKHIKTLLIEGKVEKIGRHYQLTTRGFTSLVVLSTQLTDHIRLHNVVVKIKILHKPKDWDKRRVQYLIKKSITLNQIDLKNNFQILSHFQDIKIKSTSKSILLYFPDIVAETPFKASNLFIDRLFSVIPYIESLFKLTLIKDRYLAIELISQHHALIENEIAKKYNKEGNKFRVYNSDGEIIYLIDWSHRIHEFESIHTITAEENAEKLQIFLKDLAENEWHKLSDLSKSHDIIIKTQLEYSEAIKEHLSAIREIAESNKELRNAIKELQDIFKDKKQ